MNFDLAEVDTKTLSESGVEMPVRNLDGQPMKDRKGNPISIKLLGPDSTKYRTVTRAQVRKRIAMMAETKREMTDQEIDEVERDSLDILVACTVAWKGVLTTTGEPIPCNEDSARKLYLAYPVIREQVDNFLSTRANFISASSAR